MFTVHPADPATMLSFRQKQGCHPHLHEDTEATDDKRPPESPRAGSGDQTLTPALGYRARAEPLCVKAELLLKQYLK